MENSKLELSLIKNKFCALLSDDSKKRRLIVFIGVIGMALILVSELLPKDKTSAPEKAGIEADLSNESYKTGLEKELTDILGSIKGVGDTKIMLTLDGTTEYVYAEELDTVNDNSDTQKRESYKSKLVITERSGEKQALIKKIIRPQVTGVIVACTGGDDIMIKEQVISAVSAVLDIPAGRVCVLKLE